MSTPFSGENHWTYRTANKILLVLFCFVPLHFFGGARDSQALLEMAIILTAITVVLSLTTRSSRHLAIDLSALMLNFACMK